MALFVKQDESRSQLQERIAAELQEKLKSTSKNVDSSVDGVDDSRYLQDTKQTTSLAWAWVLIVIAIVAIAVWIVTMLI